MKHQIQRFSCSQWRSFYARRQYSYSSMDLGGENPHENWPGTRELKRKQPIVLEEMAHYKYNFWKLIELSDCFKDGNGISLLENKRNLWGIVIKQKPAQINLLIRLSSSTVSHEVQMNEEYFFFQMNLQDEWQGHCKSKSSLNIL